MVVNPLFRLLLVLLLVLNGIGNAMAAVTMPAMMDAGSQAAMTVHEAIPTIAGSCGHTEPEAAGIASPLHSAMTPASHPADCDQDCCARGSCSCPCMQLAQAPLLDVLSVSVQPGHIDLAAFFPAGHSTPALLHPIRPPIG